MEPGEVDCGVVSIPAADLEEVIEILYDMILTDVGAIDEDIKSIVDRLRHARGGKEGKETAEGLRCDGAWCAEQARTMLEKMRKPEEPKALWEIFMSLPVERETAPFGYNEDVAKVRAKVALDWFAERIANANIETRTAMDHHNMVMQILEEEHKSANEKEI